jgi:hypothetical protein
MPDAAAVRQTTNTGIRVIRHPERGYYHLNSDWPWLMLPANEERTLTLDLDSGSPTILGNVDGAGYSVYPRKVFQATLYRNQLRLRGTAGILDFSDVALDVYQPGRKTRIWISRKAKYTIPLVVHYVEHGPGIKNRTTHDILRRIVKVANGILVPQTNVTLTIALERVLTYKILGVHLGLVVPLNQPLLHVDEYGILESHRINIPRLDNDLPPLNLFLVRELTNKDDKRVKLVKKPDGCFRLREVPSRSNVLATTGGGCCVFEDVIKGGTYLINEAGCLLAHEVGHHRGLDHHEDPQHVMYPRICEGTVLGRFEIEKINMGMRLPPKPMETDPHGVLHA